MSERIYSPSHDIPQRTDHNLRLTWNCVTCSLRTDSGVGCSTSLSPDGACECHIFLCWKSVIVGLTPKPIVLPEETSGPLSCEKRMSFQLGIYSWSEVKSGVIQGSILGPVLFLMFVNDMPAVLRSSNLAMFTDDSKCFKAIRSFSDCSALQTDLSALNSWSVQNEIYFQPSKCHNLRISRKKVSRARLYTVNGTTVEMVAKEKDLGITITKDLTWNNHLKAIVSKANRKMGFIKRNCFALLNTKTLILLYTSLVRSYFCYASQVWAPQSIIQDLMLVENTQRRATKFICKSDTFSYKDRLLRLRLLPLNYWLEYLDLVFFFKCKW